MPLRNNQGSNLLLLISLRIPNINLLTFLDITRLGGDTFWTNIWNLRVLIMECFEYFYDFIFTSIEESQNVSGVSKQVESKVNLRLPFQLLLHQGVGQAAILFPGMSHLPLIHTLWYWVLSKEESSTICWVFGMT